LNININEREIFIPVTNGNDKAEKPIKFHLRFLTASEQSEMEYFQYVGSSGKSVPKVRVKVDSSYIFEHGVDKIENLTIGENEIDTAGKYMAIRGPKWLSDMLIEVALHLKNAMEIDRPN